MIDIIDLDLVSYDASEIASTTDIIQFHRPTQPAATMVISRAPEEGYMKICPLSLPGAILDW